MALRYDDEKTIHAMSKKEKASFVSVFRRIIRSCVNSMRCVETQGYKNRSLAVADMMRDRLVEHRQETEKIMMLTGTVTLVYDHHKLARSAGAHRAAA